MAKDPLAFPLTGHPPARQRRKLVSKTMSATIKNARGALMDIAETDATAKKRVEVFETKLHPGMLRAPPAAKRHR
jgi:hypothetical protein